MKIIDISPLFLELTSEEAGAISGGIGDSAVTPLPAPLELIPEPQPTTLDFCPWEPGGTCKMPDYYTSPI